MTLKEVVESVKEKTGIVTKHLEPLQGVAKEYNCIIGIRPVDPLATGLIEEGHSTKDMSIKGKSASWGPQAGTICVDQTYSKLEGQTERVKAFSKKTEGCIDNKTIFSVPLTISMARLDYLLASEKLTDRTLENISGVIKFNAPSPSGTIYNFEATRQEDGKFAISSHGKPIQVLAAEPGGKAITADYDLYVIAPHISDMGPEDVYPIPDVTHGEFTKRTADYSDSSKEKLLSEMKYENDKGEVKGDYTSEVGFYDNADKKIGNASRRDEKMIPILNKAMVGEGAPAVVHHATDTSNPVTEDAANYPATFALPTKLGIYNEITVIENQEQMLKFIQQAKDSGYHVPLNPLWEGGLADVVRSSFTDEKENFKNNFKRV
ncbi:CyaA/EF/ExoY family adenylyl cyclase toxin [Pseudomonas sp. 6D_7.1_Bac1]|uniref:CyaA/EF/ExoY family adenylyl cyclase toxin n=1 Tax=Pseudomonas sp. 6D_7.1_Bac1 TaxID=2971615 RepID=UPI0021C7C6E2|nr:CyaA/EF/ExoY family adenylyl cyclase toxin [Pseudomonas sp. 6D_7.1_Bac1]MCU1748810.1 CyaA/EF/ExoY family adenylyl cyclase toxin [Pseudomonas sp. 6D_7.1_Bac1]